MKTCVQWALAGVLALGLIGQAAGQVVTSQTIKDKKMKYTNYFVLTPPPVTGKSAFGPATAKGVVLAARDWKCGRSFTDDQGRHWNLVHGVSYTKNPQGVSGWLVQPENQPLEFLSTSGRLFRQAPPAPMD